jgi:hypothetical protein
MPRDNGIEQTAVDQLTELVHELLDAHCDTVWLVDDVTDEVAWSAHVGYLRDLQRVGNETLAQLGVASAA